MRGSVPRLAKACLAVVLGMCLADQVWGQFHKDRRGSKNSASADAKWRVDPYTKNDQEAFEQTGYVAYAPFHWADNHHTRDIDKLLPKARFLWVETLHFKIASSLPASKIPKDPKKRKQIRNELKELKKTLHKVNPRTKVVDRWLRVHLFAARLEQVYADFQELMRVSDTDFPSIEAAKKIEAQRQQRRRDGQGTGDLPKYMGRGPTLGMRGKLHVMLCSKASTLGHYSRYATGKVHDRENAHQFIYDEKSLFFGTNLEIGRGSLFDDSYLHLQVVFTVTGMLIDGYKDNTHVVPPWLRQGLSNWFVRRIDPEEEFFYGIEEYNLTDRDRDDTDWAVITRRLVKHGGGFKPPEELLPLRVVAKMNLEDQMTAWSRCDFLIKHDPEKFARFMDLLKVDLPHEAMKLPTDATINENQKQALKAAYGFDYAGFETAWRKFVVKNYPKK